MSFLSFLSNILDRFFPPAPEPEPTLSIGEIAAANDNFDILEATLNAAGLADTFTGPGDFTVFAPTDAAFVELASNTLGLDVTGKSETEIATMLVNTLGLETLTSVPYLSRSRRKRRGQRPAIRGNCHNLAGRNI